MKKNRRKQKLSRKQIVLWLKKHRQQTLAAGVIVVGCAGAFAFTMLSQHTTKVEVATTAPKEKPKPAEKFYSPLTGELVKSKAATTMPVTAIMIENSPSARPQSGLKQAGVVFEAIAEGGITRFLAIYQQEKPKLVGPVRSLRMYFVDWLAPFQASVAHVGGSYRALKEIRSGNYRDIDQFFNAGSYWRSSDRYAPHNVYTNFQKLDALNKKKGYAKSVFKGFPRKDGKPAKKITAAKVSINFSSPSYNTSYTFDKKHNRYLRSMGGQPHVDREKGRIAPSVVVAMKVDETTVMEDGYRQHIQTTGTGDAVIFQNGSAQKATWAKKNRDSQTVFKDGAGEKVELNRGQTWIAAVPNSGGSVSWR